MNEPVSDLAVLTIHSGFPSRPGTPNTLYRTPYKLMRQDFYTTVTAAGYRMQPDTPPKELLIKTCAAGAPACTKLLNASVSNPAAATMADIKGDGTFPQVQPGTYYLVIYGFDPNRRHVSWIQQIVLQPGANEFIAGMDNATQLDVR
jgi:hypothetical protein